MPASKRRVADPGTLRHRFAVLRRRLRLVAAFRGVSWLLVVVLASGVAAGLLDWRWHLPDLVRGTVLVATLAGAAVLAYRHLFRPLSARADDLTLALRVEERYPTLNDALASTVEFLGRKGQPDGESASMQREAVRRALVRAAGCDFGKVIDARGLRTAGLTAGAALAVTVGLGVLFPGPVWTALTRLADPFGGHDWPRLTQLEIEPPRTRIGRNEAFEVRGTVRGVVPPQATILFFTEGFPPREHQCEIRPETNNVGHLATRLEPGWAQRSFSFQVRANDALSPKYDVQVLPPPSLVALDEKPSPQVRLFYPAYTGLPPESLSPGTGTVEAVTGTRVLMRARADRPLARAWIEYRPEMPFADLSAFLAPLGAGDLFSALALDQGGRAVWEEVPAALEGDHSVLSVSFTPRVNGTYSLHIEDDSGLGFQRTFELRLRPDPAPTVKLERPSPTRDVLSVLPTASLNLEAVVEDPQFAVRSVFLEYRTDRDASPRTLFLYDPREAPGPQVALWAGPGALAASPLPLRPARLEFKQALSLTQLRHPDGSPLKEGDVVILQACADDYDDVTVFKEPGRSHQVEVRIVGRNALELVLNQEQARVQQELMRLREKEREALQKVTEVENRLRKGEKPTAEDSDKLIQAEQIQQQIRERVGDRKEGTRADVQRILDTLKQNGLENTAVRDRMRDVGRELDRLAENELSQIEPRLTNARQMAELLDERAAAERKAQLEKQSAEAERKAKEAQQAADKKAAEAARAEKAAEDSPDPADKARHAQEARRERERAEELKQQARELRQQAERDRRDAAQAPDPNQPRQALAEARKRQEEVEKTINDLLTRLEPWSSSREIKGEANRLLEEQKQLQQEVEKLMDRKGEDTFFKPREELNERQRAELDNLKEAQQRLEERARQLLSKMDRVAQERAEKDRETANELRGALKEAKEGNIDGKMAEARKQLEQNQLGEALGKQKDSVAELQKLVKNLEDRREAELDRLAKKMRQAEKKLAELIDEQERLQKKVKEAKALKDAAQRDAALKDLAGEQQRLQKKTKEMMEELARLRAGRANHELGKATEQMEDALQQLARAEDADQKQEDALDRLDEALEELEQARKQAEEQLSREQLTRIADVLKRLKERQESMNAEAERIQKRALQNKGWTRGLKKSLLDLHEREDGLGGETETAGKELTGAPVFARQVRSAAEAMRQAGKRAEAVAKDAEPDALTRLPDAELGRHQGEAVRRLAQLLEAVKSAAEAPQRAARKGNAPAGQEGGGGGPPNPGDGIPPVAQYKLLRDMESEIYKRTEDFKKNHPDLEKLAEKDKAELQSLQKEQRDVAELLDELNRSPADGDPGAGNGREGDKK
jgi:hypothetical protein